MPKRFLYTQIRKFSWIGQQMNNFPIGPNVKIALFGNVMSIDMTLQKLAIFTIGA